VAILAQRLAFALGGFAMDNNSAMLFIVLGAGIIASYSQRWLWKK
jgi:hypothetical protein